ncbi:1,5-anhydro-D-fructose reductase [Halyomorpha halys]|uniref:1,5-anhydro-D-fructose reductase n=1 Tax=Halyomorpha halys TaxID=286706 RepID=UPI0006D4C7A6|nr:1,5-anhydro-D-fructose reductase [Halyomorpha halys]
MEYHPGNCIDVGGVRMPVMCIATCNIIDENLRNGLNTALDLGYRRFKTTFGECNTVGIILKECFEKNIVRREDLFISAKLPPVGNRYEDVELFLKKYLEALQLDYVDLYEIGSPIGFIRKEDSLFAQDENGDVLLDLKTDIVETWKGMEEQVIAGRARTIGLACFNQSQLQRIIDHCTIKPACLSTELHVYCQEKELVSLCKRNGIAVTAFSPLGSPGLQDVIGGFDGNKKTIPSSLKDPVIRDIARKYNKQPSQILLRFLLEYGVSIAIKSVNPKRLKECSEIFDFELSREEFDRISDLDRGEDGRTLGGSCGTGVLNDVESHPGFPWKK